MALKSSMKILLVDESPNNRQVLKRMLTTMGFKNVSECGDGEKAWGIIQEGGEDPVQLIICEWELPKLPGLDLLKQLRADPKYGKTKFLMVTDDAAQQNVVLSVKAGVSNVVVRPFSVNILTEKISKIFNQAKK